MSEQIRPIEAVITPVNTDPILLDSVESSQIEGIGHSPESNTLAMKFKNGGLYHYANVTPEDFAALKEAESVGSHFYKHIKPFTEKYPFKRID